MILLMKGLYSCMRFFKRQAVLLSSAKWKHNCDPPPVLEEHGGKQRLLKEQGSSGAEQKGCQRAKKIYDDSEAPPTALGHTWVTSEAGDSRGNKRGQPPRYFGRHQTAYAKPICLKEFLKIACSPRKKPDAFLFLYKSNHGVS